MQKPDSSSTKTLGAAIRELVQNLGIGRKIREYDAVVEWNAVMGEQIARVTEAVKIDKGILIVKVHNSPWRNELNLLKQDMITKLNKDLGEVVVKDIKFV